MAKNQNSDDDMISLYGGAQIRRGDLRHVYAGAGVKFGDDGTATLTVGEGSAIQSIELDEDMLLNPQAADWQSFKNEMDKAMGTQVELFDLADKSHEFTTLNRRYRNLGRIWHHDEYVGLPPRLRRYYTYLRLEGDLAQSPADWEQILQYVVCVLAAVGLTVLISLLPGGEVVVANFIGIVGLIAAGCFGLVTGVGSQARNQAWVNTFVDL